MFMTNEEKVWTAYNKAALLIESCKTISHLLSTRQYLKQFQNQLPQKYFWMVQKLDDAFNVKKKKIVKLL